MGARCYTVATLAAEWECSPGVIRKAIADGRLGHFRIGTLIRIPREEVERFECLNTPSNDSAADSPSSTETPGDDGTGSDFKRPTGLGRKRKLGAVGQPVQNIHRGPWAGS